MTGNFQRAAMFIDSWNAPMLTTESPKKQTQTWSPPRYRIAYPAPIAMGRWLPTIPCPPMKLSDLSNMCIEPPKPFEQPSTRP